MQKLQIDIKNILNPFWAYDCSIIDFYNKYIEDHITKNSEQAYDFWKIFNENGMQFDKEDPQVTIDGVKDSFIVVDDNKNTIDLTLYDNVKVSKVEFIINGKASGTYIKPKDNFTYTIPKNQLNKGINKLAIKVYDNAGNKITADSTLSKLFPANDFFRASIESNNDYNKMAYKNPYIVKHLDLLYEGEQSTVATLSSTTLTEDSYSESTINNISDNLLSQLVDTYSLTSQDENIGNVNTNESIAEEEFQVNQGMDYGIFIDDTLGDFELILRDPNGIVYSNLLNTDESTDSNENEVQYILNLGTSGFMLFHPIPGTWTFSIRNLGTDADYHVGIYTKLSAPIILNEDELLKIQDGSVVNLLVSGSINNEINFNLIGESGGINIQDKMNVNSDITSDYIYAFNDLPDDHYTIVLYAIGEDGSMGWKKESEIIVDTSIPDISLEEDYEFYTFAGNAIVEGVGINASLVSVYLNGEGVPIYGKGNKGSNYNFATDNMILNYGNNTLLIIAETETGKIAKKELILKSATVDECFTEQHKPVIDSVLFDGKEEAFINENTNIKVKLNNSNADDFKVYAICNDKLYDFIWNGENFTLDYVPDKGSGNYMFTIHAVSKWFMHDYIEIDIIVQCDDDGFYLIKQPEDIYLNKGDTAILDLSEIFGGNYKNIISDIGLISDGVWTYTAVEEGIYEVFLMNSLDGELITTFYIIVESSDELNIELNANGGNLSDTEYYVTYGEAYGDIPIPTRNGYTFLGWFTEKIGGDQILPTTIVTEADSKILYAHWKIKVAVVLFDPNGGTVTISTKNVTNGGTYGTLPTPVKQGFTFLGWFTKVTGGEQITSNSNVDILEEQILYAHWNASSYSITFFANGGTVSVTSKSVINGNKYGTLPIPTKTNYNFSGWYTKLTGGTLITEDTLVNLTGNQILYAMWNTGTYEVSFNANGGNVTLNNKKVTLGSTYGTLPIPVRENYVFKGWYTKEVGGDLVIESNTVTIKEPHTLHAHWTGNKYTVTLDSAGGLVSGNDTVNINVFYGDTYGQGLTIIATKPGNEFLGWYTKSSGGELVTTDSRVGITQNQILYAQWREVSYIVNFNANGGSVPINTKSVTYGSKYGSLPTPTKNNYVFIGWYTKLIGGNEITENDLVNITNTQTLYAHWIGDTYEVVFDSNGGSVTPSSIELNYGDTYGNLPIPTKTNYTFIGWFSKAVGGVQITSADLISSTSNHTLFAHWMGDNYQLILDANGGTIEGKSSINVNVNYGEKYGNVLNNKPINNNYEFIGWFTQPIGGVEVTSNNIYLHTKTQTLYAQWKMAGYQVIFNANGGDVVITQKNVINGNSYGTLPVPTKLNFIFVGWYTDVAGGVEIKEDSIVNLTSSQTLYARWIGITYKVTFESNGGVEMYDSINVKFGSTYGTLPIPTRIGYTFAGWYTQNDAGELIRENSIVSTSGDHKLYAHWYNNTSQVIFDANGGLFTDTNKSTKNILITKGKPYGYLERVTMPIKEGYEFDGWYTERVGGVEVKLSDIVEKIEEHTLYAHWREERFEIYFYANGGEVSVSSKYVTYGGKYGPLPVPTRENYIFLGWFDQLFGGGREITENSIVDIAGSHSISAQWKGVSKKVSFDANGGTVSTNSKLVDYGDVYGTLPIPTRTGYTFIGWHTSLNDGTKIIESSISTLTKDQTLYAYWSQNSYVVNLDANGGLIKYGNSNTTVKLINVIFGNSYGSSLTESVPTKTGYEFIGWFTEKSGGTKVSASDIVKIADTHTLYAHWTEATFTVYYNSNGGTVSISSKQVKYKNTYGELAIPTRLNYIFIGWFDQVNGGNKITEESTMNIAGNSTIYAQWIGESHKVMFNSNGGVEVDSNIEVIYGSTYGTLPVTSRPGYTFLGWYTETSGGTLITAYSTVNITEDKTLFARWTPNVYKVTFVSNGQQYSVLSVYYNTSISGKFPQLTQAGYDLIGWYSEVSGGIEYNESTILKIQNNITLYARWKGKSYNVTFNANGGSVSQSTKVVTYQNAYGKLELPTRENYIFTGWYDRAIGGTEITELSIVNTIGDHSLYAQWIGKPCVIPLDANGGNLTQNSVTLLYGSYYGELPIPSRTGYNFTGWYTDVNGGNKINYNHIVTSNLKLYAHWTAKSVRVNFIANGGIVSIGSKDIIYKDQYGNLPIPSRMGYTFLGWFTEIDGGLQIKEESTLNNADVHELYARWKPMKVKVSFDANAGQVSSSSKEVDYDSYYGTLPIPTRTNYSFVSWRTSSGTDINENSIVSISTDHTLYATWRGVRSEIVLNPNGGSVSENSIFVYYKSHYGSLPTPVRSGYNFNGWYTVDGIRVTSDSTVEFTSNGTLYAQWTIKTLTLIFLPNGGSVPIESKVVTVGEKFGELPTPIRAGYTFYTWAIFTSVAEPVNSNTIASSEGTIYIHALWN
jgi:uncharacterized repeat protein (TIGR02543 family)